MEYHSSTTIFPLLFLLSARPLGTHYISGTVLGDAEIERLPGDTGTLLIRIQSVNRSINAQQILEALRSAISTFGGDGDGQGRFLGKKNSLSEA